MAYGSDRFSKACLQLNITLQYVDLVKIDLKHTDVHCEIENDISE